MTLSRRVFMRVSAAAAMSVAAGSAYALSQRRQLLTASGTAPEIKTAGIRLIPIEWDVWGQSTLILLFDAVHFGRGAASRLIA